MSEEVKDTKITKVSDSNILAALSYFWILSIIFYVIKKDDEFVQFHAKQAMVIFGISVIGWFTMFMFIGFPIGLIAFILIVIGAVKAYTGEKFRFPVIADLAEKINF